MKIRVDSISKTFKSTAGLFKAVDDVSFEVESGSLVALLGPSGSGKSTVLRILAGLDSADSGQVYFGEEAATDVHARARSVGFVFQHYALFRHLTVGENIAFGLDVRGVPKEQARERVRALLQLTSLSGLEHRYPAQLSGGQRQRVALARALAPDPKLLLLDEPFGAIDAKVREELREWIRKLHDEVGVTSIFVTHDQDEAFSVADRVLLIHKGKVEQLGSPTEILDDPQTEFVARFVGEVSAFAAHVQDDIATAGALRAKVDAGHRNGEPVSLVIRSYDVKLWREDPGIATVQRMVTLGDRVRVYAEIDGAGPITAQFPRRSSLLRGVTPGCRVQLEVTTARAYGATNEVREPALFA